MKVKSAGMLRSNRSTPPKSTDQKLNGGKRIFRYIALGISFLSEPWVVTFPIVWIAMAIMFGGSTQDFLISCGYLALFLVPLLITRIVFLRKKSISDWDLSNRHERVALLSRLWVFMIPFLIVSWFLRSPMIYHQLFLMIFLFAPFFMITLEWKISGHTIMATTAAGLLFLIDPSFWWILPFPIFVAWSRILLKRHTLAQAVGGILYAILFLFITRSIGLL